MGRQIGKKILLLGVFALLIVQCSSVFGHSHSRANLIDQILSEGINSSGVTYSDERNLQEESPFDFSALTPEKAPQSTLGGPTALGPSFETIDSLEITLSQRELTYDLPTPEVSEWGLGITDKMPSQPPQTTYKTAAELPQYCMAPWVYSSLSVRHTTGRGIGYKHGYTTLGGMFFPAPCKSSMWPFIDVRLHYFDNHELAANIGLGLRRNFEKRVLGVNVYFDYRSSEDNKFHFTQSGLGLELLGCRFDLRLNAYLPIKQKWLLQHCHFTYEGGYFIDRKRYEAALTGFNFELGTHVIQCESVNLYAAVGPYYYGGAACNQTFGGKLRVRLRYCDYLSIEGALSHDHIYKTRLQGQLELSFPLGCNRYCSKQRRLSQRPERNDIIVVDRFCKWKFNYKEK